jgi:hypothetical protein
MKAYELDYLKRALAALEDFETTDMARAKILRTMSQICGKCATEIEDNLVDNVEVRLYNSGTVNE